MARYRVIHETAYDYGSPVSLSQQMLHLSPRPVAWQRIVAHGVEVVPAPSWRRAGEDAFGNPVEWLSFESPHTTLRVRAETEVEVLPHAPDSLDSPAWEAVRDRLAYAAMQVEAADLEASRYQFESPLVRVKHEFAAYAAAAFSPGTPILVATERLMRQIHEEFEFDPEATTISTPVTEVLEKRRGVCQDFAHLMIACLRSLGLPARYMSGYLLTHPPAGRPRLVGADASHAWVAVYCPGVTGGWVEFDPTNSLLPDTEHIALAVGRDFSDVSPLRGIILGGGGHEPEVAVTVLPLEEAAAG